MRRVANFEAKKRYSDTIYVSCDFNCSVDYKERMNLRGTYKVQ